MDESHPDDITKKEWENAFKAAKNLYGPKFNEMVEAAEAALAPLIKGSSVVVAVNDQTNKILYTGQMDLLMLRAAAYMAIS